MVRIARYLPWVEAIFLLMLAAGCVMLYQNLEGGLLIIALVCLTALYFISAYKPIEITSDGNEKFGTKELLAWTILPKLCWISCAVSTLGWLLFFINPDNVGYKNMLMIGALSLGAALVMIAFLISTGVRQMRVLLPVMFRALPLLSADCYLLYFG